MHTLSLLCYYIARLYRQQLALEARHVLYLIQQRMLTHIVLALHVLTVPQAALLLLLDVVYLPIRSHLAGQLTDLVVG